MRRVVIAAAVATMVPKDILLLLAQAIVAEDAGRRGLISGIHKKAWVLVKADPNWSHIKNLRELTTPWDNQVLYGDKNYDKIVAQRTKMAKEFIAKYGTASKIKEIKPNAEPLGLVDSLVMQYISEPATLRLTDKGGRGPVSVSNKAGSKILSVCFMGLKGERNQFMGSFTASGKWKVMTACGVAESLTGKSCTDEQALQAVTAIFELAKKKGLQSVKK